MPVNASVTLEFGPYEACGTVEYRTSRLQGLENQLSLKGHTVQEKRIKDWNAVRLIVNGETVFTCNINNMDYGGDGALDPICLNAVQAVENAY